MPALKDLNTREVGSGGLPNPITSSSLLEATAAKRVPVDQCMSGTDTAAPSSEWSVIRNAVAEPGGVKQQSLAGKPGSPSGFSACSEGPCDYPSDRSDLHTCFQQSIRPSSHERSPLLHVVVAVVDPPDLVPHLPTPIQTTDQIRETTDLLTQRSDG